MPIQPLPASRVPNASRAQVPPAEIPGVNGLLTLAVGVVVVAALYLGREVLIPVTLAVLLSFVLAPLVRLLRHAHLPRVPAVLGTVVLALGLALALAALIGLQVASLADDFPRYQVTLSKKVQVVQDLSTERLTKMLNRLDNQLDHGPEQAKPDPTQTQGAGGDTAANKPLSVEVHQPPPSPVALVVTYLAPVLSPLATVGIVFIVAVFILLQQDDLRDRMIRLFGSRDLHRTTVAMDDAARRLSKYFLTQLAINSSFGIVIGAGLFVIGVPSAILWGVVAALMRFVPYVGSWLAAIGPLALAAAVDPGWSTVLWTVGLFGVFEFIMGQAVEPILYGHSTGLSSFAVVVSAIFWTWLWGPIGLILSTPLTLCLVVLGRHVDRLEFLDVLFGDRPALTPVESFYQRILADDPDDVIDSAELLLRERSLSSYYDEVAIKGLQLAAHDVARGVLAPEQLSRIREAIAALIEDLDEHEDTDPEPSEAEEGPVALPRQERALPRAPAPVAAPIPRESLPAAWQGETPILCIAGRGPFDEPAAAMLAQVLTKHGLGARALPHAAASRSGIGALEAGGVAMVCVTYLEIDGAPSNLRYLLRRLHARLPGRPVLVGLWPSERDTEVPADMADERIRAAIGADYYVSTLREAVLSCRAAAEEAARTNTRAA